MIAIAAIHVVRLGAHGAALYLSTELDESVKAVKIWKTAPRRITTDLATSVAVPRGIRDGDDDDAGDDAGDDDGKWC